MQEDRWYHTLAGLLLITGIGPLAVVLAFRGFQSAIQAIQGWMAG